MTLNDRTPVLVGAGQSVHRDAARDVERGCPPHPMDLAGEAARRAVEDAGASGDLSAAIDTIAVMRLFGDSSPRRAHEHGRSSNPPRSVARRIGANPANAIYVEVGGNSPQKWVNYMAERIAKGEAEVALLAGAEAIATMKRAVRAGVKLDWNEEVEGSLDDRGLGPSLLSPYEIAHGITFPTQVYPLFEQAIRHRRGVGLDQHLQSMGRLFEPFTEVAAENPYSYFPKARSARELATPEGENPFIALPYGRLMNARDGVDQGAAVILTSVGRARSLGIPSDRWVFLHGCADASEPLMSEREDYTRCPAIRTMAGRAFAMAKMNLDDVAAIDLYSCFPSAVEVACVELGLAEDDSRRLTMTGGLPFFGGPGNNYSMHGIAEAVRRMRGKPDEVALVTANGGYLSKHSMGLYSARPVEGGWKREDPATYQAELAARPKAAIAEEANGAATIETYTVVFDDQAAPRLGIVVGRLEDGRRFLANVPQADRGTLDALVREDAIGRRGRVDREGSTNVFRM